MISVLSPSRKSYLHLPLLISCWFVLTAGFSHATMTADDLYKDLAIAQEAIKGDDPDLAEKLLRKTLQADRNNAQAHHLLGTVFLKKGLRDAAIAEFTTAMQIDPQDELTREYLFSIYYNRAQDLLEIPQEAYKAREELEKAIAIRPGGIMSYYFLGTLNYQEKRDAECIAALFTVVNSIPEQLQTNVHTMLYNSAFNLLNQNKAFVAKEVVPYFSRPPQATINELLLAATITLENGDFAESIQLYDRILCKDPLHAVALHNRGIAQQRLDEIRPHSPSAEKLSKPPETPVTSEP